MNKDYLSLVESKSTEELVIIIINKDEYKEELVQAAENELKKRNLNRLNNLNDNNRQSLVEEAVETPFGIYIAGILHFFSGIFWLFVGLSQSSFSILFNNSSLGFISFLNILSALFILVFGIGILKRKIWGYNLGLASAFLGLLFFSICFFAFNLIYFLILFFLELTVVVTLLLNKNFFIRRLVSKEVSIVAPQNYIEQNLSNEQLENLNYKNKVLRLNQLIRLKGLNMFNFENGIEIKEIISELCPSKEHAEYLLKIYHENFSEDLIEDLKELSNSYDTIKDYCRVFINLGLVSKSYPHNRI